MRTAGDSSDRTGASFVASLVGRDDSRVVRALEEYLAAIDEGGRVSRSEFLSRHPELSSRLRDCLESLEALQSAAPGFFGPSHAPLASQMNTGVDSNGRLGDYQIMREVGRGGMGVVYEAIQVSLGRRVALKVLPTSLAVDPRQLQRFRIEAQAAAQLHHSNIVPVFAVGSDHGVHYYAMQFIDGPSLAQVICELRSMTLCHPRSVANFEGSTVDHNGAFGHDLDPGVEKSTSSGQSPAPSCVSWRAASSSLSEVISRPGNSSRFRAAARLGVQAARALDHAHRLGVVHRDIKPANLMLDSRGNLWVTDFGLARTQEETGLTISGDLLGTLRYMSPEQASGRRAIIDHRADIYALGATLYELIALRAAAPARERNELLRQITQEEPAHPRRIDATIPRELDIIILKAMAKEPGDRYATAGDLADDLQRFLDDKPIHARPPSVFERSAKLARRHRSMVAVAALLLLFLLVVLGISNVQVAHQRDQIEAKRRHADKKFGLARGVIDKLYMQFIQRLLAMEPQKAELQHDFLRTALGYYKGFAEDNSADPIDQRERAMAYHRIGEIQYRLGRPDEAEQAYRQGLAILERLSADPNADGMQVAQDASLVCKSLGRLLQATIRDTEAEEVLRRAIAFQKRRAGARPGAYSQLFLSELQLDRGRILHRQGKWQAASAAYDEALRLARTAALSGEIESDDVRKQDAAALVASIESQSLQVHGNLVGAIEKAKECTAILRRLLQYHPSLPEVRNELAQAYFRQAWLIGACSDESLRDLDSALQLANLAIKLEPHNALYHHRLGALLMGTHQFKEAEQAFRTVLSLVPDSPDAFNSLAWILATGEDPAPERKREAVEYAKRAVHEAGMVGIYWNTLGVAYYQLGEWSSAIAALEQSMQLRSGGDSFDWYFLAMAHARLGHLNEARRLFDQARDWMRQNRPGDFELSRFQEWAAQLLGQSQLKPSYSSAVSSKKDLSARVLLIDGSGQTARAERGGSSREFGSTVTNASQTRSDDRLMLQQQSRSARSDSPRSSTPTQSATAAKPMPPLPPAVIDAPLTSPVIRPTSPYRPLRQTVPPVAD